MPQLLLTELVKSTSLCQALELLFNVLSRLSLSFQVLFPQLVSIIVIHRSTFSQLPCVNVLLVEISDPSGVELLIRLLLLMRVTPRGQDSCTVKTIFLYQSISSKNQHLQWRLVLNNVEGQIQPRISLH